MKRFDMEEHRRKQIAYLISKELSRPEKKELTTKQKIMSAFTILSAIMFVVSSIAGYGQLLGGNRIEVNDIKKLSGSSEITSQFSNSNNLKKEDKQEVASELQNKNQDSIKYYKQVVKKNPKEITALTSLVNLLIENKQYDDSLVYIERLININPSNVSAYQVKGSVLYLQERYDEAIEVFSKVIEMNPSDNNSYKLMGDIALKQAKYESAISYYQNALAINEKDAAVYQNIGVAAVKINRIDDALKYYEKGLSLDPDNEQILKNKQEILKNLK